MAATTIQMSETMAHNLRCYVHALERKQRKTVSIASVIRSVLTEAGFEDNTALDKLESDDPTAPGQTSLHASVVRSQTLQSAGLMQTTVEAIADAVIQRGCLPRDIVRMGLPSPALAVFVAAVAKAVEEGYVRSDPKTLHSVGECKCPPLTGSVFTAAPMATKQVEGDETDKNPIPFEPQIPEHLRNLKEGSKFE